MKAAVKRRTAPARSWGRSGIGTGRRRSKQDEGSIARQLKPQLRPISMGANTGLQTYPATAGHLFSTLPTRAEPATRGELEASSLLTKLRLGRAHRAIVFACVPRKFSSKSRDVRSIKGNTTICSLFNSRPRRFGPRPVARWCLDCGHRSEPDPAAMAEHFGAEKTIPAWRARLVCGGGGSRRVDMVVSGTERR
jgi:hypothetical protein